MAVVPIATLRLGTAFPGCDRVVRNVMGIYFNKYENNFIAREFGWHDTTFC